jgi:pyrimidine deaminase RibD-like protein
MDVAQQKYFMAIALALSQRALPACLPNPPVGCVLVKNNKVVASGYTQAPGQHHAEAAALAVYDSAMTGVSAFVTLEPCSFQGRTPSCAKTLIERGVDSVYVAIRDPDPRNNGKGLALLIDAGVTVYENVLAETVAEFLAPFLQHSPS